MQAHNSVIINHLSSGKIKDSWSQYISIQNNNCADDQQMERLRESILKQRSMVPEFDIVSINQTNIYNF